jgi:hypothetical protein
MPNIDRVQIKRTPTPNAAPVGLWEGELSVEMASNPPRLWIGVPTSIDPNGRRQLNTAEGTIGNYLPLAGGQITGSLTVDNALTAGSVTSGGTILGNQLRVREGGGDEWAWYSPVAGTLTLWRNGDLYSFNTAGAFSISGNFSAGGAITSGGNMDCGWDVTVNAGVLIRNQHGGWHVFVGAADGWCEGPAHLRFGNSNSTGNHSVGGSLFVGGLQVYNNSGWLYSVSGIDVDTFNSRQNVYAAGTVSGHDVTARSGLYVGGNLLTDGGGGWVYNHSSLSSHDIVARSTMTIGGVGVWNDGAGRLWCGEYNCTNLHASQLFVNGVHVYNDGAGRLGVGNINVGNDVLCPNLYLNGVHCWNNGGFFYASQVRAWTLYSDSHIHSSGTINASGVITGAGVASLVDMDCGNNMTVTVSLTVVLGNLVVASGTGLKPGGGEWGAYSDRRLKVSEVPYERGLEAICALRPVTYQYSGKAGMPTDRAFIGVVADDVVEVMPEMIGRKTADDGADYMTADGSAVKWALVNAVKTLAAQIDKLGERLDAVDAKLSGGNPHGTPTAAQGHQDQRRQRPRA